MRLDIVSIFPDYLAPLRQSLVGKAIDRGLVDLRVHDLREFTYDRHRTVDDTPFGGGPGMVMKAQPWGEAIDSILASNDRNVQPTLIIPTPSGQLFSQAHADSLATSQWLIFACGRYEGIDARIPAYYRQHIEVRELSIGDYVLAGGEAAALVMSEAVIRLIPGVLGNPESAIDDSFATARAGAPLEGPVYTKPSEWRGIEVPEVLLSGNHAVIAAWRDEQALDRTIQNRPELIDPAGGTNS